jgi:elongation factor Ts
MSEIPADLVKKLRDMTGAGFMDAKRALQETNGDLEAAAKLLRERGMAEAAKRAGRETSEGEVLATISGHVGAMVAVGCQTDFVASNDQFLGFAEKVLETVEGGGDPASLENERQQVVAALGENVEVRGAVRLETGDGESLAEYVHPPANKIGVLVHVKGENPSAARQLAMHISFAAPRYATRTDVPEEDVAAEREIYSKQPDIQSKPEDVREKIVEGMLGKRFFAENVLADQAWIHDTSLTVAKALEQAGLELVRFERFALAG